MTAPVTNTETAMVIDILRKQADRLRRENEAHRLVAINIQDTLTKSTAQYTAEIAKLKELLNEAATKMGFVSAWLGHPHDKTLAVMRDKLREAAK